MRPRAREAGLEGGGKVVGKRLSVESTIEEVTSVGLDRKNRPNDDGQERSRRRRRSTRLTRREGKSAALAVRYSPLFSLPKKSHGRPSRPVIYVGRREKALFNEKRMLAKSDSYVFLLPRLLRARPIHAFHPLAKLSLSLSLSLTHRALLLSHSSLSALPLARALLSSSAKFFSRRS